MSEDASPLASLSLTHVYYDPTDPVSLLCAYLSLLPQALMIVYATLLLSTREVEVLLLFTGQLACEAANFILKRVIKEARPPHLPGTRGYGMPSSHAQFVAFWSLSVGLFMLVRHGSSARVRSRVEGQKKGKDEDKGEGEAKAVVDGAKPWPLPARLLISLLALMVAGSVAASRIYLGYHTPRQVLAGLLAGTICAVGWFVLTSVARSWGLIDWLLTLPLARMVLLRDLIVDEDPCWAGWERWEWRKRDGGRKVAGSLTRAAEKMKIARGLMKLAGESLVAARERRVKAGNTVGEVVNEAREMMKTAGEMIEMAGEMIKTGEETISTGEKMRPTGEEMIQVGRDMIGTAEEVMEIAKGMIKTVDEQTSK
ncbi:related to CAX4 protein [Cephalotrichum gorgonifer]|uniref:Dolichyldiphosphatase n=1 Tax=Cephalotrichum gorgonifer TaxID=2041049 RepID=A0AAE8MSR8_9PEZI|nr:related to CAX4 protein [Cephalotrichum gorgonifer]